MPSKLKKTKASKENKQDVLRKGILEQEFNFITESSVLSL